MAVLGLLFAVWLGRGVELPSLCAGFVTAWLLPRLQRQALGHRAQQVQLCGQQVRPRLEHRLSGGVGLLLRGM